MKDEFCKQLLSTPLIIYSATDSETGDEYEWFNNGTVRTYDRRKRQEIIFKPNEIPEWLNPHNKVRFNNAMRVHYRATGTESVYLHKRGNE